MLRTLNQGPVGGLFARTTKRRKTSFASAPLWHGAGFLCLVDHAGTRRIFQRRPDDRQGTLAILAWRYCDIQSGNFHRFALGPKQTI